jgi:hypothetical protein
MRMDAKDQRCWRICVFLAALCSVYALTVTTASADPLSDELATLKDRVGCSDGIPVIWVSGLRIAGHDSAAGAAPGVCQVTVDVTTRGWTVCEQRRLALHEAGHIAGLPDMHGGIMDTDPLVRNTVVVPGCPAVLTSLRERVSARVLDLVPKGWGVSCGPRRGLVLRCVADNGAMRGRPSTRMFRARLWDASGMGFTVVRIRSAR